jgi:asparagine synthase (glutamine-hydrolysing)
MSPDLIREAFEAPLSTEELYAEVLADWNASPNLSIVDKTLQFYTNFYLRDNILVKADRAAMLSSLESRAVFLDNDVVDFARSLPSHFKYRSGQRKYILKKALRGIGPVGDIYGPPRGAAAERGRGQPPCGLVLAHVPVLSRRHGAGRMTHGHDRRRPACLRCSCASSGRAHA